jgi:hypothetical protein
MMQSPQMKKKRGRPPKCMDESNKENVNANEHLYLMNDRNRSNYFKQEFSVSTVSPLNLKKQVTTDFKSLLNPEESESLVKNEVKPDFHKEV